VNNNFHLSLLSNQNNMTKFKAIIQRFLKGIIAGAVASMLMVSITQPTAWVDFNSLLNSLGLACAFGGITGFLLALQKWVSWEDDPNLALG
jgi:hypothetical protein